MNHDIFISYSSKMKQVADGVCHYIESNGLKCWMAPRNAFPGIDFSEQIDEAIKNCKVFVLIYSRYSLKSEWVKGEVLAALDERKPIIPFRIDNTKMEGMFRLRLNTMHWIDAFPSYADRLPDLLNSICGITEIHLSSAQSILPNPKQYSNRSSQFNEAEIHIEVDTDCLVYHFHKEVLLATKGKDNTLMLKKGKHKLSFKSLQIPSITVDRIIEISDTDSSDIIEVFLLDDAVLGNHGYVIIGENKTILNKEDIDLGKGNTGLVKIADSVTVISENAFCFYEELLSVIIPNSVYSIGDEAFEYCTGLKNIIIPNTVISIGEDAFLGVKNIIYHGEAPGKPWGALTINGFVENELLYPTPNKKKITGYIGNDSSVIIPNSVLSIGSCAFQDCRSLISVVIPNTVTKIGVSAFGGCSSLESIILPNTLTTIENGTFYDCIDLSTISIPNSVTKIEWDAFYGCIGLNSINIPDSITVIEGYAFHGCSNLKSIVIPESVKEIGPRAFAECNKLETVRILNRNTKYDVGDSSSFPNHTKIIK